MSFFQDLIGAYVLQGFRIFIAFKENVISFFQEGSVAQALLSCSLIGLGLYTLYGAVWRLYLCPQAHIPGPWFAKLTFWNEFYYDVVCGGQYTWKLLEYHNQYGPVIRINPYEVHIKDVDFIDQMYVGGSKRRTNKWAWAMKMFGQYDESAFDTLDHEKHRLRREPWGPYFSKQSVSRLQPTLIQDKVNLFCSRLAEHKAAGKPVTMIYAYACVTTDIISDYCYPSGYNYLSQPDFDTAHYDAWMVLTLLSHTLKQFGWLFPLLNAMPPWLTKRTSPEAYLVQSFKSELTQQAKDVIAFSNSASKDSESKPSRPSLLQALYESPALPPADKALSRLAAEAQTAIAAGTLTSSHVLKAATFHILANPRIRDRLMEELEQAIPDIDTPHPPNLRELEAIEYLVAIMYESLRIAHGVSGRLQRIFPDYDLPYRRSAKTDSSDDGDTVGVVVIPRGTPISMTPLHAHEDPRVFVDPYTFDPERWIPLSTNGLRLQKYLMCFGAGSRICVGMELGKAEILTCLASVFRRFGGRGGGG